MTLDPEQRRRTGAEMHANLALSGLTADQVGSHLGFTHSRTSTTLDLADGTDPVDVWQLRDHLLQTVQDAGGEPAAFSVLTDAARRRAAVWFQLRPAP